MALVSREWCAHAASWWIKRNPTYLLSAASMAVGAKLYLHAPDARTGDVGLMLGTLGVLQAYELAVAGVLTLLQRIKRSRVDRSSLLLVVAVFWTAPLAATVELMQDHYKLGLGLAVTAAVIAGFEMRFVARVIGMRLSPAARLAAGLCLGLLIVAPVRLRIGVHAAGTDELALYACWWLLALIALLAIPALRWQARRVTDAATSREHRRLECSFLIVLVAATATQLYAMNYAFFGNGRAFYCAALLGAACVAAFEWLALHGVRHPAAIGASAVLPAIGIALATQGFAPGVPADQLSIGLRDPLLAALLVGAAAWWFGSVRLRSAALLHAGSAAALAAGWSILPEFGMTSFVYPAAWQVQTPMPYPFCGFAFGLAVYLLAVSLLRRGRIEALAALVALTAAIGSLVFGRTEADTMIIVLAVGWAWLVATHLFGSCARWWHRTAPVALLLVAGCFYELDGALGWIARSHTLGMSTLFIIVGWRFPNTAYRLAGMLAGSVWLLFIGVRALTGSPHASAALACAFAFLLLAAGALISWHKPRLLRRTKSLRGGIP